MQRPQKWKPVQLNHDIMVRFIPKPTLLQISIHTIGYTDLMVCGRPCISSKVQFHDQQNYQHVTWSWNINLFWNVCASAIHLTSRKDRTTRPEDNNIQYQYVLLLQFKSKPTAPVNGATRHSSERSLF